MAWFTDSFLLLNKRWLSADNISDYINRFTKARAVDWFEGDL